MLTISPVNTPDALVGQYNDLLSKAPSVGFSNGIASVLSREQTIDNADKQIWMPVQSLKALWRKWNGEFTGGFGSRVMFYQARTDWNVFEWQIDKRKIAQLNQLGPDWEMAMDWAMRIVVAREEIRDETIETALANSTNSAYPCIDGQAFFSTSHPQDPTGHNTGSVWSNLHTGRALTEANVKTAITEIRKIKSFDGKPMNMRPYAIVVGPNDEWKAKAIFGYTITVPTGATDTPKQNLLYGEGMQIIVNNALDDGSNAWYLLCAKSSPAIDKPFILAVAQQPKVTHLNGGQMNNEERLKYEMTGMDHFAMTCNIGFSYNLPYFMHRYVP